MDDVTIKVKKDVVLINDVEVPKCLSIRFGEIVAGKPRKATIEVCVDEVEVEGAEEVLINLIDVATGAQGRLVKWE